MSEREHVIDTAPPVLSLRGVTKSYTDRAGKRTEVLAGLDLDVGDGEFVAILGFSGAGKTTLISAIAGLVGLDGGEIQVRGTPTTRAGRDRGVVFQSYSLLPWASVEGNVRLAVDAVHRRMDGAERDALTSSTIELVGLAHAKDRKSAQLSGGMRQRVAVARALAMQPDILLLDEPLSALDALTRARLQEEIERIRAQEARTMVLVTNDVDEALLLADRVAILEPGPRARIAHVFDVAIERPRDRAELNHDPTYVALRKAIVSHLETLHATGPSEAGAAGGDASAPPPALVAAEHDAERAAPTEGGKPYITFAGVTKVYPTSNGELTVVDGFELDIERGEFVSLIGHSGCGKSTVLSMAAGLISRSAGDIALGDDVVRGAGPDRAMVFQAPSLLPWLTARDNVALGVQRRYRDASKRERTEVVEYYLRRVGLAGAMDRLASQLSNGMRQRVGLARAFALHPRLLLLDEPFGMLDTLTRWDLQDVLLDVWQKSDVTAICVTHDVDEAILLADRVVMMTNGPNARVGRILAIDLPRPRHRHDVFENPAFYDYRAEILHFLSEQDHATPVDVA